MIAGNLPRHDIDDRLTATLTFENELPVTREMNNKT